MKAVVLEPGDICVVSPSREIPLGTAPFLNPPGKAAPVAYMVTRNSEDLSLSFEPISWRTLHQIDHSAGLDLGAAASTALQEYRQGIRDELLKPKAVAS